jgi:hypothetical protein
VDGEITYLNTDLDLISAQDLSGLGAAFDQGGAPPLHVTKGDDGLWYSIIETKNCHAEPEASITEMVSIVESFSEKEFAAWQHCTKREFNIGYDCGPKPWGFNQGLSTELLGRIAAIGASLRITIYPQKREEADS